MERVDAPLSAAVDEAGVASLDGAGRSLSSLVSEVSALGPLSAREQVPRVLAWLESAPATQANAKDLVALLDADAFAGLSAPDGRPLKVDALLALLRFGYPWALQVRPEDLAWLREQQRPFWRRNLKEIIAVGLWVTLAAQVATLTYPLWWAWLSSGF